MALQNRIANRQSNDLGLPEKAITYECGGETVKISPTIIRNYLVSGNGTVTDQEVAMFLNLCRYQHLNPFLREAYLIKFGNQPATIVIGKEAFAKRAMRNPSFEGYQAGVVVWDKANNELVYRAGSLVLENETLAGGWAKVFVKGYQNPIEAVVSFGEYVGRKSDGTINDQWKKKPATMIRKVALVQALREAFPEDLGGLYASEEVGVEFDESANTAPVEIPQEETAEPAETPEIPAFEELGEF